MLVLQKRKCLKNKKYIIGKGLFDNLSSFTSNVGLYINQNKDLILKPVLGGVGSLAATGITSGIPYLINKIKSKKKNANPGEQIPQHIKHELNEKSKEILKNILQQDTQEINLNNVIGSGVKKKIGRGIKIIK